MAIPFLIPAAISIASEFFPVLATRLGGSRGRKLAEQVIDVAADVAGTPPDADPREIIASLKKDQNKAAEVRLRLEELDQEEHERIIEDRINAREYQARIGGRGRVRGTIMLICVVLGLLACILAVLFGRADPAALALLTTIAGALLKMLSDAFAFEFGSSQGSREKGSHIERIQQALVDTARDRSSRLEAEARAQPRPTPAAGGDARTGAQEPRSGEAVLNAAAKPPRRDFVTELKALST